MRHHGRKSWAETEMSTLIVDASRQTPPAPPSELTDAQAQVWRDVVGSWPGNWLVEEPSTASEADITATTQTEHINR
jgi:hypothetical protein